MPLHVRLVGGWARHYFANLNLAGFFCGNVPVFIHVHVADGLATLWNKFQVWGPRIIGEMWP